MAVLRVIGDVHGCINIAHPRKGISYRDIIRGCEYSVQLGDMGFNYSGLDGVDCTRHTCIMGNHDNYDDPPINSLGAWGIKYVGPFEFFIVRGAWSIDIVQRKEYQLAGGQKIWWEEEELSRQEMEECFHLYKETKPEVVMSHSCPLSISSHVGNPDVWKFFGWEDKQISNTQYLLEYMLQIHQPRLWLFGHFHRNWERTVGNTTFRCVDILDYIDFNEAWEIV